MINWLKRILGITKLEERILKLEALNPRKIQISSLETKIWAASCEPMELTYSTMPMWQEYKNNLR
jgi:hypothetical protein